MPLFNKSNQIHKVGLTLSLHPVHCTFCGSKLFESNSNRLSHPSSWNNTRRRYGGGIAPKNTDGSSRGFSSFVGSSMTAGGADEVVFRLK